MHIQTERKTHETIKTKKQSRNKIDASFLISHHPSFDTCWTHENTHVLCQKPAVQYHSSPPPLHISLSPIIAVFAILTCVTAAVTVAVAAVSVFDASTAAAVTSLTLHMRACVRERERCRGGGVVQCDAYPVYTRTNMCRGTCTITCEDAFVHSYLTASAATAIAVAVARVDCAVTIAAATFLDARATASVATAAASARAAVTSLTLSTSVATAVLTRSTSFEIASVVFEVCVPSAATASASAAAAAAIMAASSTAAAATALAASSVATAIESFANYACLWVEMRMDGCVVCGQGFVSLQHVCVCVCRCTYICAFVWRTILHTIHTHTQHVVCVSRHVYVQLGWTPAVCRYDWVHVGVRVNVCVCMCTCLRMCVDTCVLCVLVF